MLRQTVSIYEWYQVTSRAKSIQEVADAFCEDELLVVRTLTEQQFDKNIRKNLLFSYYWNKNNTLSDALLELLKMAGIGYDQSVASVKASNLRSKGWKLKSFAGTNTNYCRCVFPF